MTDNSDVRPVSEPSASSSGTALQHLGQRALNVTTGQARIDLAHGLSVSWKSTDVVAGPGGVTAQPASEQGVSAVRLTLPADLGWVRLNCALDRPEDMPGMPQPPVLACRMLVYRPPGTGAVTLTPVLAQVHRTTGRAEALPAVAADITVDQDGWHLIQALYLCAPDTDTHRIGLTLRLPEDCAVTLGPIETDWFGAAPVPRDMIGGKDAAPATILRPATARPLTASSLQAAMEAPYASGAMIESGDLTGWVLMRTAKAVRIQIEDQIHRLPLGAMAEPWPKAWPGLRMPCGFSAPLMALLSHTPDARQLTCYPENTTTGANAPTPFAELPVPEAYRHANGPANQPGPTPEAPDSSPAQTLVFHAPPDIGTDPYRKLLYRAMHEATTQPGDVDAAITRLEAQAAQASAAPAVVLHLHRLGHVLTRAQDRLEAERLCADYIARLTYFVHLGGVLIWTIDGPLPEHAPEDMPKELDFDAHWRGLGQQVIGLARTLHLHSASARDLAQSLFDIPPEKVVIGAHPSYLDHYPDYVDQQAARERIGITPTGPDDAPDATPPGPVFLLPGRLYPGKGIDALVAAFHRLRETVPEAWLIIMGDPAPPLRKGVLTRSFGALPHVKVIETRVADTTLQWYYRAADWVVLPYRDVVTPKSLICAMSFGVPVVAPRLGPIPDLVRTRHTGLLYDPAPSGGDPVPPLAAALAAAAAIPTTDVRAMGEAARTAIRPHSAAALANTLGQAIQNAWPFDTLRIDFEDTPRDVMSVGASFPPAIPARTAVIILNYGYASDTRRLINTLQAGTDTDIDIYVIDNCSPNLSAYDLATRFSDVHVLRLPENLGYAAGNNAGLRLIADLPYEFVWILNPDMAVPPQALAQHIDAAGTHPETDIFGPALLRGGPEARIASAGCYITLSGGLQTGHLYAGELTDVLPAAPYEADFVTGAALFLRRRVLDTIGLIPEDYFLYFEETAWLTAARAKGKSALVLPHIRLAHHKRSEDGDLPAPYFYYYYTRNALIFTARTSAGDQGQALADTAARLRTEFITGWTARIGKSRPDRLAFYTALGERALADGLAGHTGPVDLVALELATDGLPAPDQPAPTAAEQASCTAIIDDDGLLVGQIALAPQTAAHPCHVTALMDGRIIGHMIARPVIPPMILGDGRLHSFQMPLPERLRDGRGHRLGFYLNGRPFTDSAPLPRFLPRPAPQVDGKITGLARYDCTGWLTDAQAPHSTLMAEIVLHDPDGTARVVGRGPADLPRPDGPDTGCFRIRLPRALANGKPHKLGLRQAGSTVLVDSTELADAAFGQDAAPPDRASAQILDDLRYDPVLWLGDTDPDALPLTAHLARAARALAHTPDRPDRPTLVSVILPVHNRPGPVLQAIRSVQAQRHTLWELIVIDDGSTDGTGAALAAHLQEHPDSRIRVLRHEGQSGAASARNAGLAQAHGEVIAYLDSDDTWDPDYLTIMTGILLDQPEAQAAYAGTWIAQTGLAPTPEVIGLCLPPPALPLIENRDIIALSGYVHRAGARGEPPFDSALRRYSGWELILRHSRTALPHPVGVPLVTCHLDAAANRLSLIEPAAPALARIGKAPPPAAPAPALRPLDAVLRAPTATDAPGLRRWIAATALTLTPQAGHRLIVQAAPQMIAALSDLSSDALLLRPTPPGDAGQSGLATALEMRRAAADLAIIEPSTMVQSGWIQALTRALTRHPQAGLLLTRHGVSGRAGATRVHAPAMAPHRDACITVSAKLRNLIEIGAGGRLDPVEGVMTLSGFDPFCTFIPADVARQIAAAETGTALSDHATQLAAWADFVRLHMGRPLLYCPRAPAFEIGV